MKTDKEWFKREFVKLDLSASRIAKMLGMDRSQLSKRLSGVYETSPQELQDLARIMKQPMEEVARRLGVEGVRKIAAQGDPLDGLQATALPPTLPLVGGWTVFYARDEKLTTDALEHLCVGGRPDAKKGLVVGKLTAIKTGGKAVIEPLGVKTSAVVVGWASRVVWVKAA